MTRTNNTKMHGDNVNSALRYITDILDSCQIPHFLIGDTARMIFDDKELEIEKLEIGVKKEHMTQDTVRLIKTVFPLLYIKEKISLEYLGVPIEIRIVNKKYGFLEHLDTRFYMADEYKLPNPFEKYWKIRNLIA